MTWEQKLWGQVWHLFSSDQSAVSFLQLVRGTRCSRHWHDERANLFAVISGKIEVQEWPTKLELSVQPEKIIRCTTLGPGETHTISSGHVHRFRVLESGQLVEVYWPDVEDGQVRFDDIHRLDEGGMDTEEE